MGVYEVIRDCVSIAQKADNIPLVQKLIEAQKEIMDLMEENRKLKDELRKARETECLAERIVRHKYAFITLKDDDEKKVFCSYCWDKDKKLIQVQIGSYGMYHCQVCKSYGRVDDEHA